MSTTTAARIHPTATAALSSTIKHHLLFRPSHRHVVFRNNTSLSRRPMLTMASAPTPLQVCVKSSITVPNKLGDCNSLFLALSICFPCKINAMSCKSCSAQFSGPFCQRVLLTLEEKHLPYDLKLVDLANKPDRFLKINPQGKVPVVNLGDKWIADSDIITQVLEDKYPEPPLATPPDKASVGSKIFSTFIGFLKSKDPKDGTEQALINELSTFNDYLEINGPFVNGDQVSSVDLSLAPKLYHLEIALGHFKSWSVPDSLPFLKSYIKSIFSRDSFTKTSALKEDVIAGWQPKVLG